LTVGDEGDSTANRHECLRRVETLYTVNVSASITSKPGLKTLRKRGELTVYVK
jgi:hypothetical protein